MKLRNTLILIAVFGALAAYFLLVEKPAQETPVPTVTPAAALNVYDYVTTDVLQITVSEGPTRTVIQRDNEKVPWQLIEPVKEMADEIRANAAASQFALLRASRVLTDPADISDLSAFGLANPKVKATMKVKDGTELVLWIGDNTPEGTNAYVQKEGEKGTVYVIGTLLPETLKRFLFDLPIEPTPVPTWTPRPTATLTVTAGIRVTSGLTVPAPLTDTLRALPAPADTPAAGAPPVPVTTAALTETVIMTR